MDEYKSRWAIVAEVGPQDLKALHDLEVRLKSQGRLWENCESAWRAQMIQKYALRPFWPAKMTSDEQANRMRLFERMIYPVWKPIYQAWEKSWQEKDCASDLAILHRTDIAILKSGVRVDRNFLTQADEAKAARADMLRGQFRDAVS